jgi:hypothetical protein
MASHLELFSHTDSALVLPTESNGSVQLNISTITHADATNASYEQLVVFVEDGGDGYGPNAVQGRHTVEGDYLVFSPYFPFERGMTYVVRTNRVEGYSYQSFVLGEKPIVNQAKVVRIYPSGSQLPENLLRFYIYFNTPMQRGQALKHIQLIDSTGNIDHHVFMEFKQELWSPDGKRLTILFDPGRIKRGVSTNMELGSALLEDNQYHLTISTAWQDVYGQPLSEKTMKEFVVVKAYRQHLKANRLQIDKPKANSDDTLSIHFDRVMDHALVQSMIQIRDEERNLIVGRWITLEQEQLIQFIPEKNWQTGRYQIVIDSRLEDVAGNNLQTMLDQIESDKENNIDSHQTIDFKV